MSIEPLNKSNEKLSDTFFHITGMTVGMSYEPINAGVIYTDTFLFARQIYIETGRTDFNDKYEELKEEWDRRDSTWMDFGLVNMTGHPAISIPCGKFDDGCPIGIHVIGRWDGEQDLIDLASRIEATEPWLRRWSANR